MISGTALDDLRNSRLTMTVQGVHARKLLVTAVARKRAIIGVKLFVPFAVVLSSEAFAAPWPFADEGLLLVVRSDVAF